MSRPFAEKPRSAATPPAGTPLDAERGAEALARWKLRHGMPDALARWHEAKPGQGGPFAFAAIVDDPFALTRMRLSIASLLVQDAGDHADHLAATLPPDAQPVSPAAAAVAQVRVAVASWRRSLERRGAGELFRPRRRDAAAEHPAFPGPAAAGPFDRFDPGQGRVATNAVARLGAAGLARMAFREARVLAGAVTRFVGGTLLSSTDGTPAAWEAIRRALLALQGHAAAVGASILLTDDYRSRVLPPGAVAAQLSADLAVCGAAIRTVEGASQAPGFPIWAAAEEAHAVAALALDPAAPTSLSPAAAARLVRAARRGARGRGAASPGVPEALSRSVGASSPGTAGDAPRSRPPASELGGAKLPEWVADPRD